MLRHDHEEGGDSAFGSGAANGDHHPVKDGFGTGGALIPVRGKSWKCHVGMRKQECCCPHTRVHGL